LEFLSATIGHLVWPALIGALIFFFKEPVKELLASRELKNLKAGPGGVELQFDRELKVAEAKLEEGDESGSRALGTTPEVSLTSDFIGEMAQLAAISPRSVVLETHTRLEKLLRRVVTIDEPRHGERRPTFSMRGLSRLAVAQDLLTPQEASALDELTLLRNRIAHEPDELISEGTSLRYAEAALQIAYAIRVAIGQTQLDGEPL